MRLSDKISRSFSERIRSRGNAYWKGGAVEVSIATENLVDATVRGTQDYSVLLSFGDGDLSVHCDCPYFAREELCKHVWAAIREAETIGALSATRAAARVSVVASSEEEIFDGAEEEDEALDAGVEDPPVATPERPATGGPSRRPPVPDRSTTPPWSVALAGLQGWPVEPRSPHDPLGASEILYVVLPEESRTRSRLVIETWMRQRKKSGAWGAPRQRGISDAEVDLLPDARDRRLLALLRGTVESEFGWSSYGYAARRQQFHVPIAALETIVPLLCETGRCVVGPIETGVELGPAIEWDGSPWTVSIEVAAVDDGTAYEIGGSLRQGEHRIDLALPALLLAGGVFFLHDRAAGFTDDGVFAWIALLRQAGRIRVPAGDRERLIEELARAPALPRLELPPELSLEVVRGEPRPRLRLEKARRAWSGPATAPAELSFDYGSHAVRHDEPGESFFDREHRRRIDRDLAAEAGFFQRLVTLGARHAIVHRERRDRVELSVPEKIVPRLVRELLAEHWSVEVEGRRYRASSASAFGVVSGVDWFELEGRVDFGEATAELPALLAALRRGEHMVELDDGSFGLLPETWVRRLDTFASFGETDGSRVRFKRTQVGLLDALLAAEPEATCDEIFARAREQFRSFHGIEPADPPPGFRGELRHYQREGLGWIDFLRRFGFGGCLADDMGLGKTVQVLAMLAREHAPGEGTARSSPSLVVVPRSLLFNWRREAERFAPDLRLVEHVGTGRDRDGADFSNADVVLTTYGTLRRDVAHLRKQRFAWAVLDEAQAIKNAATASAKAVRLLDTDHRLALSGTPIENHLGELWSLFEFLNPGMLGRAAAFGATRNGARQLDEEGRALLARAIRPFVLRRTKAEVAPELPARHEQTIHVDLDRAERALYDELRDHYRRALLGQGPRRPDWSRNKIQVLEALLRLRQAACHPGLLDAEKRRRPSAKLEILLAQLAQVVDEGHKAIVFSQFTTLLAIVRDALDAAGIGHETLDGRTRDREARVDRFQSDPAKAVFLVSLKAGGVGLNLTAAEYVYLLDPWWNPAAEAQAIDRTHRIGQTRPVFAYRLIARNTVEEKVLELQRSKRALADSIIGDDGAIVRDLTREELERLLA